MMEIIFIIAVIAWSLIQWVKFYITKSHEEDIFTVTLHKEKLEEVRAKLPFWKDGDNFMIQP